LKATGRIEGRGIGTGSRNNPALAVGKNLHKKIGAAQQALALFNPSTLKGLSPDDIFELSVHAL